MLEEEEQRILKSLHYRDNTEFFDPKYIEVDRILAEREDRVAIDEPAAPASVAAPAGEGGGGACLPDPALWCAVVGAGVEC